MLTSRHNKASDCCSVIHRFALLRPSRTRVVNVKDSHPRTGVSMESFFSLALTHLFDKFSRSVSCIFLITFFPFYPASSISSLLPSLLLSSHFSRFSALTQTVSTTVSPISSLLRHRQRVAPPIKTKKSTVRLTAEI